MLVAIVAPFVVAGSVGLPALDALLRRVYSTSPPGAILHFDYYFHTFNLFLARPVLIALGIAAIVAGSLLRDGIVGPKGSPGANPPPLSSGHRSPAIFAWALAAIVLGSAMAIGRFALQDFPNSADEWGFQLEARTFADGRLWRDAEAHPLTGVLGKSYFVEAKDGKLFSTHFPGWPMLLALGYRAGVPQIVNPCLAALTILAIFFAARAMFGTAEARCAAVLCALSPMFLLNSASYFSQPTTLCCTAVAIWALARSWSAPTTRASVFAGVVGGFAVGVQFLARPYSALAASGPVILGLLFDPDGRIRIAGAARRVVPWLPGMAVSGAILLAYDHAFTGRWFLTPYAWAGNPHVPGFVSTGYVNHTPLDGVVQALGHLVDLHAWMFFGALLLLAPWLALRWDRRDIVLAGIPLAIAFAYFFFPSYGGNQYGPRYWYEAVAPLCLLAARGAIHGRFSLVSTLGALRGRRAVASIAATACVLDLVVVGYYVHAYRGIVHERTTPMRMARAGGLSGAVVLLRTGSGTMELTDLVRNDPCCSDEVIWAYAPEIVEEEAGPEAARRYRDVLLASYRDRSVFAFRYGAPGERGIEAECVRWPPPRASSRSELRKLTWVEVTTPVR